MTAPAIPMSTRKVEVYVATYMWRCPTCAKELVSETLSHEPVALGDMWSGGPSQACCDNHPLMFCELIRAV